MADGILSIVQGDVFDLNISFESDDEILDIEKVIFSCKDQNVVVEFQELEDYNYYLEIPGEVTKNFIPRVSSFDINIVFIDGETLTMAYQNRLQVLRKFNKVE